MPASGYFETRYKGPWKGINVEMPENDIDLASSRSFQNFILKHSEIRTRPKLYPSIPPTPDKKFATMMTSFMDSNGVTHTVVDTPSGLWQLNANWVKNPKKAWSLIGSYPQIPGPGLPDSYVTFVNKIYWTNGGVNLWSWDGITSVGTASPWTKSTKFYLNGRIIDSNGNVQICTQAGTTNTVVPVWNAAIGGTTADGSVVWTNNGKPAPANGFQSTAIVDATNGITAGAYFLGELNSQLIMLSTIEGNLVSSEAFPQRIRWCPSGIPNIWDSNVNIGAGFLDELDVPDAITGFLTIGRTGFIFRTNGITEMGTGSSGINPWTFNHLWASERGIGNIFPFSIAGYGPIGIFASSEDFYEVTLGGFEGIGKDALDAIYDDIAQTSFTPIASIIPYFAQNYIYPVYKLDIIIGNGTKTWLYNIKEKSWTPWFHPNKQFSGRTRFCING